MRFRLRTLLILLAILPPLLWFGWTKYEAWRAEQEAQREMELIMGMILPQPNSAGAAGDGVQAGR